MIKIFKRYTRIFRNIRIPWVLLLLLVAITVIRSHTEVESVSLTASIIDASQSSIKTDELVRYIIFLVLNSVLNIGSTYVGGLFGQKLNLSVRMKLWNKMMRLPTRYYDGDNASRLVTRITTDADSASQYFQIWINIFTALYAAVVAFQKLYKFQAQMATAILGVLPLVAGITVFYSTTAYKASAKTKHTLAATMGYLAEHVRGLRLIKSFGMEGAENRNAEAHFNKQCKADILMSFTGMIELVGMQAIGCISIVISFVMGGHLISTGAITVGKLIGFYTLSGLFTIRAVSICSNLGTFSKNAGNVDKVSEILESEDESVEGMDMDVADDDIVVENVTFAYQDAPVLKDISCVFPKGKITAVVGTNGAGKTTLFKLLERMYQPDSGRILFGSTPINEFSLSSWRKSLAIVAQDKPLISGTVKENILYGIERTVTDDELIHAAKMANAYDFIMETPDGFDTQTGPGGSNFSGGQQQCIAIARAMMRNPDYLLLDEATSNLDAVSERQVTNALHNLMRGRTTVMIAHKYSATVFADQVIVMEDGRIQDAGTPGELLKRNAYYRTFAGENIEEEKNEIKNRKFI